MTFQIDEVTLEETIDDICCTDCKSSNIIKDDNQPPFFANNHKSIYKNYLIIPLICEDCKYSFSLRINWRI